MKVLIVEDEPLAAAQLAAHLSALRPDAEILAVCDTVKAVVDWMSNNEAPQLAFFDIQLGDGLSFDIFEQIDFKTPVIFTTAYNEYAIRAFKVNSIDYLLKPIERPELEKALIKFEQLAKPATTSISPAILAEIIDSIKKQEYKERFLVKVGMHLRVIETNDILYFYSFEKGTYAKLRDGKDYLLDQSLELVEGMIDPSQFFRINRKYLVALKSINDVVAYSNSRLKLKVKLPNDDDFLVAREKVKDFKNWLEGEI
ncbi:LytR/AlgR family response regulator transcription factor [Maribellus sediminis]|uniref:LytR/AlgR family response regulator transcription factor n=1 Tax=Maribellus sediminis TaxID=2696285 RepID=UPI0014313D16|nr:LytTR family DNA-binding domain-containing protein [Maribellus sediminis]